MRSLLITLLLLTTSGMVSAQQPSGSVDADRLPLDVNRIRRQLETTQDREERDGLNLRYFVSIYGEAPAIRLFLEGENLRVGPVPNTAPTHQEFLDFWTPKAFNSPIMDFGSLFRWLAGKGRQSSPQEPQR